MSEPLLKTPCAFGENGIFLLERELGAGGMGGVYMGRDRMLDRPVAVKVMHKEYGSDPEFVEKFKKEAQAAARLIHPNIAQIYSYGISNGMPYIAMELVAGGSLWALMQAAPGKTDITRVIKICQQVAQALQCASDQGFVHGDIKPENVLLDANGNAKLVDFGLAGMQKDTKEIWGTPYYIAPEKVQQQGVDFRADMYNLGGTLYHALTNKPPFDGPDVNATVRARFVSDPKKPSELRSDIPPAVDALVMRMLAREKTKRYPSFEALIEAFKNVLTTGLDKPAKKPAGMTKRITLGGKGTTALLTASKATTTKRKSLRPLQRPDAGEDAATEDVENPVEPQEVPPAEKDEEEEGGNLGLKVFGVIGGVIAVIGAIVGGLIWYQAADKKAREEQTRREILAGIEKAQQSLTATRTAASTFGDEFEQYAGKAMTLCQATSDDLKKILPEWAASFVMPSVAQGTNTTTQTANASEAQGVASSAKDRPSVIDDMHDLWLKALECQAAAGRIRQGVSNVLVVCDTAAQMTGTDRASMEKLGDLSREAGEKYEMLKMSKDVENVKKANALIKKKGETSIRQTVNQLRIKKLEETRKAQKEKEAAEEKARLEAAAASKAQLVDAESASAKEKFDALVAAGVFDQLDWESAIRQLKSMKNEFKTPEGSFAVDYEIHKVESMKMVQDIFRENLSGYVFKKGGKNGIKGNTVKRSDANQIFMTKKDGKSSQTISWRKFYKEYHGNLNELINVYVVKGRENGKHRLNLKGWADAMCGAALTMRIVCGDDPSAAAYGETLVKQVAEAFPDYQKNLQAMFPDIALGAGEATATE